MSEDEATFIDTSVIAGKLGMSPRTIRFWLSKGYIKGGTKKRNIWQLSLFDFQTFLRDNTKVTWSDNQRLDANIEV